MYHFFIHSSVERHLGCFHVVVIVNSAAMNWDAYIFLNYDFIQLYAQEWDCWITWWFYLFKVKTIRKLYKYVKRSRTCKALLGTDLCICVSCL